MTTIHARYSEGRYGKGLL